jgi:hypothetical protein
MNASESEREGAITSRAQHYAYDMSLYFYELMTIFNYQFYVFLENFTHQKNHA